MKYICVVVLLLQVTYSLANVIPRSNKVKTYAIEVKINSTGTDDGVLTGKLMARFEGETFVTRVHLNEMNSNLQQGFTYTFIRTCTVELLKTTSIDFCFTKDSENSQGKLQISHVAIIDGEAPNKETAQTEYFCHRKMPNDIPTLLNREITSFYVC